jgi:dienelactone hydrolase
MTIHTRLIEYALDADTFEGYLAWDDRHPGPRPGIAIAHTWAGRGEFEEQKARDLAAEGYAVLALDVYGRGVRGSSPEENSALMAPLLEDRGLLQARLTAGLEALSAQSECDGSRLAAVGYCFGGLSVLDLARVGAPVRSVVSIHGLFHPPANAAGRPIRASVLCLHGYDDPMARPESLLALAAELTGAGADWQVHAYGNTVHAFTNPRANNPEMGTVYSARADARAWRSLCAFLEETLAPGA